MSAPSLAMIAGEIAYCDPEENLRAIREAINEASKVTACASCGQGADEALCRPCFERITLEEWGRA